MVSNTEHKWNKTRPNSEYIFSCHIFPKDMDHILKIEKKTFLELVQFHPNYVSRQLLKRTNLWFKYGFKWMFIFGAMAKKVHWILPAYFVNIRGKLLTNLYFSLLFF